MEKGRCMEGRSDDVEMAEMRREDVGEDGN